MANSIAAAPKAADPKTAGDVIYLVSCAVNGTAAEKARIDAMDLGQVLAFAFRHMLRALVSSALLKAGFGLREYADCDILFDAARAEDVRALMEEQGYTTEQFGAGPHDIYHKAPL